MAQTSCCGAFLYAAHMLGNKQMNCTWTKGPGLWSFKWHLHDVCRVRTTQTFSDTLKLKLWQMETINNATISGGRNRNYQSNCARPVRASLQSVPLVLSKLAFTRPNGGRARSEVVHQRPYRRFSVQRTLKQLQMWRISICCSQRGTNNCEWYKNKLMMMPRIAYRYKVIIHVGWKHTISLMAIGPCLCGGAFLYAAHLNINH